MPVGFYVWQRGDAGKRTGNGEYSSLGGDAYAGRRMVDAQHAAVFPAVKHGVFPKTPDRGGGTTLPDPCPAGGSGCKKRPD